MLRGLGDSPRPSGRQRPRPRRPRADASSRKTASSSSWGVQSAADDVRERPPRGRPAAGGVGVTPTTSDDSLHPLGVPAGRSSSPARRPAVYYQETLGLRTSAGKEQTSAPVDLDVAHRHRSPRARPPRRHPGVNDLSLQRADISLRPGPTRCCSSSTRVDPGRRRVLPLGDRLLEASATRSSSSITIGTLSLRRGAGKALACAACFLRSALVRDPVVPSARTALQGRRAAWQLPGARRAHHLRALAEERGRILLDQRAGRGSRGSHSPRAFRQGADARRRSIS